MNQSVLSRLAVFMLLPIVGVVGQSPKTRDSLGIRIIETTTRGLAPVRFSLSRANAVAVGGLENDANLELNSRNPTLRAIRLANGSLVVADMIRLQVFDASGRRVGTAGQRGSGPGEFRSIVGLCRTRGDTVVVSDEVGRRISVFDGSAKFVKSFPIRGFPPDGEFCFADGSIVVVQHLQMVGERMVCSLIRVGLDGSEVRPLGKVDFGPFDALIARERSIVAAGLGLYFGNGIENEIQTLDAQGRVETIIRTADRIRRITEADLKDLEGPQTKGRSPRTTSLENLRITSWPAYRKIRTDPLRRIWVQEWTKRPSEAPEDTWTVFDSTGTILGRLVMPRPATKDLSRSVLSFGADEVILRETDSDGAVHVVVRKFVERSSRFLDRKR